MVVINRAYCNVNMTPAKEIEQKVQVINRAYCNVNPSTLRIYSNNKSLLIEHTVM